MCPNDKPFDDPSALDNNKSKTAMKKHMHELQSLGITLSTLNKKQLADICPNVTLLDAIIHYQTIKSNSAKKRQAQYIGKQMRLLEESEIQTIEKTLNDLQTAKAHQDGLFHRTEKWRTRLLEEGKEALTAFLHDYPKADAQTLRHLIQKVKKEQNKAQNLGALKTLFRYIRTFVS